MVWRRWRRMSEGDREEMLGGAWKGLYEGGYEMTGA